MITNCWGKVPVKRIPVEDGFVYQGRPGTAYNHQSQLTTHQGALVATWTLGVRDEEGPGEDMVFAVSEDHGKSWSPPKVVVGSQPGRAAKTVVVSSGVLSTGDEMVAFAGHWDRTPAGVTQEGTRTLTNDPAGELFADVRTDVVVSRDGGVNWSAPVAVIPNVSNYAPPFRTASGRLILPSNLTFPWTDDPTGQTGWTYAGIPGMRPDVMDNYFNMFESNELGRTGQLYNEGCCYQLADGTLRMMLRNETSVMKVRQPTRIGVSESRDDGLTWTTPVPTDYTCCVARSHFGRLPNGRYFGLNCPNTSEQGWGPRTPVILALSDDGTVFDKHFLLGDAPEVKPRWPGYAKNGRYGYPFLHVDGEFGFVSYSLNKEDIGLLRFRIEDLK